ASAQDGPRTLNTLDEQTRNTAFPPVALARGVSGAVTLSCEVGANDTGVCRASEESPAGYGFAAAAERLSSLLRFAPIAGTVAVPVLFENQNPEPLVIETPLVVEGGSHIDVSVASDPNYLQVMGTFHALAACNWSGRPDCATTEPGGARPFYNISSYPTSARDAGVGGRALVACAFRSERQVDCALEAVSNTEHEFGAAAVDLVRSVAVAQINQFEAGQTIRVPVSFSFVAADGSRQSDWLPSPSRSIDTPPTRVLRLMREGVRITTVCTLLADGRFDCEVTNSPAQYFTDIAIESGELRQLRPEAIGLPGYEVGDRLRFYHFFRLN
ncbi:MAG: hypothetical protein K2X34_01335, partial [Hyphomonadaceae bacterium]|nr:hypothetical protein [Hyphomonadaceae bacterium]